MAGLRNVPFRTPWCDIPLLLRATLEVTIAAFGLILLFSCTAAQVARAEKYAYIYCKVRDADPGLHQAVDSLVPVVGPIAGATVGVGCVIIESTAPITITPKG